MLDRSWFKQVRVALTCADCGKYVSRRGRFCLPRGMLGGAARSNDAYKQVATRLGGAASMSGSHPSQARGRPGSGDR